MRKYIVATDVNGKIIDILEVVGESADGYLEIEAFKNSSCSTFFVPMETVKVFLVPTSVSGAVQ